MASTSLLSSLDGWLHALQRNETANQNDNPNYYSYNPQTLITSSQPTKFSVGTGHQILSDLFSTSSTSSTCLSTNHELIIVTCFWARSSSQEAIFALLLKLAAKARSQNRKIHVRICFSSRSIVQKLFQTSSLNGKIYPSESWVSLGLPRPEALDGLDLVVKSVFVRPFSVMHPKFILVDRQLAFMPSCNVSRENWFEGCIEMRGNICGSLFEFWEAFWSRGGAQLPPLPSTPPEDQQHTQTNQIMFSTVTNIDYMTKSISTPRPSPEIATILLPSPHHRNPHFRPLFLSPPQVPPTPLNTFLLHVINNSTSNIYLQTPNFTSSSLISAILSALERGINIHLITSSRLMIFEQLVTAGTITEFEIWKLRRRHKRLLNTHSLRQNTSDPEMQPQQPGELKIGYFHSEKGESSGKGPVKSHLKLVIVDEEVVVLGSGNMDRASWYTSQELGITFFDKGLAREVKACIECGLHGKVDYIY